MRRKGEMCYVKSGEIMDDTYFIVFCVFSVF